MKVAFLSSGSVTDVSVILAGTDGVIFGIRQLPYGGFLFIEFTLRHNHVNNTVIVNDNNGTTITAVPINSSFMVGDFAVFPNNTLWVGFVGSSQLIVDYLALPKLMAKGE